MPLCQVAKKSKSEVGSCWVAEPIWGRSGGASTRGQMAREGRAGRGVREETKRAAPASFLGINCHTSLWLG